MSIRREDGILIETLGSAGAGWLVSGALDLGVRAIRGPEEERAVSRVTKEALIGALERYRDQIDDEEAWAQLFEQFFTDPLVCALLLKAVFRQERPDVGEVRGRLTQIGFHDEYLPFDFGDFLNEFASRLELCAQEEVRTHGNALANRAQQEKLDYLVEAVKVLLSALEAGKIEVREAAAVAVGVRSFTRWAEGMDEETDHLLRLEGYFDGRKIKNPDLWRRAVYPELEAFLMASMRESKPHHLHISAHVSVAFACGYVLNPKSGVEVAPVQRTPAGPELWRPDIGVGAAEDRLWDLSPVALDRPGEDVAVAASATHPVLDDVRAYVGRELPEVGRILAFTVLPGTGHASVKGATHGWRLAEELARSIRAERTAEERRATLHLFAAAPVGLMFFLGRLSRGFGRCVLYEYDMEGGVPGAYSPSLVFPPRNGPTLQPEKG
jgi:hypothetical protein